MFSQALLGQAEALLARYRGAGARLALAESCTGGLVSALLTEIPGSSDVVERGFVTYSNQSKQELLGVPAAALASHGAVSTVTALEMARGALARSAADCAVSITGVAGPGGGTAAKPVGFVCFGWATRADAGAIDRAFGDTGRPAIRLASAALALELLAQALDRR